LSKVHINREPSGQVRIAMMVINKRRIREVYDIRIGELESELQQAVRNNDKHLFALTRRELEDMKTWLDEEINRVNQTHERFKAQ